MRKCVIKNVSEAGKDCKAKAAYSHRLSLIFLSRPPSSHHYLPGTGNQEDGQEERHRPQPAVSGDTGLHFCYLL